MKNIDLDKLVYLDSGFISSKYEEAKNVHPDTEFTKTEGMKAGASIPMFSGGVHTQETRKFKISSTQMLAEIEKEIFLYPKFDQLQSLSSSKTELVWVLGKLSTSEWVDSKTKELDGEPYFYIGEEQGDQFPLITKSEYFLSGIDQFLNLPTPFQKNIGFPVKALIRVFYYSEHDNKYFISCPYIIYKHVSS